MDPQTVNFVARIKFNDRTDELVFNSFEKMISRMRKERHRRSLKDRATSGEYRMQLTLLGQQRCAADPYCRESHRDAIAGTWFSL